MLRRGRKWGDKRQSNENPYLEDLERPASVEPERLGQGGVERGAVGTKFLPQRLLRPGLVEQALRHPRAM
jgi:hypothetical protein